MPRFFITTILQKADGGGNGRFHLLRSAAQAVDGLQRASDRSRKRLGTKLLERAIIRLDTTRRPV
jgi:hypothetical protein